MIIGIIGTGRLGEAIIDGLSGSGTMIMASGRRNRMYNGIEIITDNRKVAKNSDVIIIAVKPHMADNVLNEIRDSITNEKIVVSIAAGLRIKFFESRVNARVVRAMTNIAVKNRCGLSAYKLGGTCTGKDRETMEKVFGLLGKVIEVDDENDLDNITGISGSGIAYLVRIISIFARVAEAHGLNRKTARKVSNETVKGAISLIENSEDEYEIIINRVITKGGTTEQGINELEKQGLDETLGIVIGKAIEKCKDIGDENE